MFQFSKKAQADAEEVQDLTEEQLLEIAGGASHHSSHKTSHHSSSHHSSHKTSHHSGHNTSHHSGHKTSKGHHHK
jgi:hypothetical protein